MLDLGSTTSLTDCTWDFDRNLDGETSGVLEFDFLSTILFVDVRMDLFVDFNLAFLRLTVFLTVVFGDFNGDPEVDAVGVSIAMDWVVKVGGSPSGSKTGSGGNNELPLFSCLFLDFGFLLFPFLVNLRADPFVGIKLELWPTSSLTASSWTDLVGDFCRVLDGEELGVSIVLDPEFKRRGRSSASKTSTCGNKESMSLLVSRDSSVLDLESLSSSFVVVDWRLDSFVKVEPSSQSKASLIDVVGEFALDPVDVVL